MDKSKLLNQAAQSAEERILLARVLDKWEQAKSRNIPTFTGFLSPREQAAAAQLLHAAGESSAPIFDGGYAGAERRLLAFLPDWCEEPGAYSPLRFLRCAFRPEFALSHRDILGSLMGLGFVREKLGDILVEEAGCTIVTLDSVAEYLLQNWENAGRAPLTVTEIAAEEIHAPEMKFQEIRDTVMTLRLDAVAAAGFSLSRSRAAELICGGKMQLNWQDCQKPDRLLREGDIVSARGLGKFELSSVGGLSRKGRTGLVLKRYL